RPTATSRSAMGCHAAPWNPVGCDSTTGSPAPPQSWTASDSPEGATNECWVRVTRAASGGGAGALGRVVLDGLGDRVRSPTYELTATPGDPVARRRHRFELTREVR